MKKYFMKGTEDELQFGDVISVVLTKETATGTTHKSVECKFIPEMIDLLLSEGIIEEKEAEEPQPDCNPSTFDCDEDDYEEPCETLESLLEDFEILEERVDRLETLTVGVCKEMMVLIKELIKENKDGHKEAQSKKKQ